MHFDWWIRFLFAMAVFFHRQFLATTVASYQRQWQHRGGSGSIVAAAALVSSREHSHGKTDRIKMARRWILKLITLAIFGPG